MKKFLSLLICLIMAFSTTVFAAPEDNAEKLLTDFFNNNKNELFPVTDGEIEVAFLADIDNDTVPELLVSPGAYFYGLTVYKVKDGEIVKLPDAITFGRGTGISENYGFLLAENGHMYLYRDSYDAQVPWERNIATQAVYDWSEDSLTVVAFLSATFPGYTIPDEPFYMTEPEGEQIKTSVEDAEGKIAEFKSVVAPYIVWSREENRNYIDLETIWNKQKALQNGDNSVSITLQIGNHVMNVNGVSKTVDAENAPVIKNKRTLVPEGIVKELGGTVLKSGDGDGKITILYEDNTIELTKDSNIAVCNGNTVTLDAAPIIANDTAMLPIRFIAECFGAVVEWDEAIQKVTITKN